MRHALAQFAKLTFQPIKPRFQRRSKMPPTYCCQPNQLSGASKRAHHIGPLDGPTHVLVFRAKE